MILGSIKSVLGSFTSALWAAGAKQGIHNVTGVGDVTLHPISVQGTGTAGASIDDDLELEFARRGWRQLHHAQGQGRVVLPAMEARGRGRTQPREIPAPLVEPVLPLFLPEQPRPLVPDFTGAGHILLTQVGAHEAVGYQFDDLDDILTLLESAA